MQAKGNDPLFSLIGALSSASALFPFAVLLLLFPHDYLSSPTTRSPSVSGRTTQQRKKRAIRILLRGYVGMLLFLGVVTDLFAVLKNAYPGYRSAPLSFAFSSYYLLALSGILCTLLVSYGKASSLRERQQQRLFVGGILVALIPCFILTVLPVALNLSPHFIVDSQLSTLTVILLPLALGYAILRYQIFVVDAHIRRMVAWIMGSIGLSLLVYLVVILANLVLHTAPSASTIILPALVMAPSAPFV